MILFLLAYFANTNVALAIEISFKEKTMGIIIDSRHTNP